MKRLTSEEAIGSFMTASVRRELVANAVWDTRFRPPVKPQMANDAPSAQG